MEDEILGVTDSERLWETGVEAETVRLTVRV